MKDYYQLLQISSDASLTEIRKAFRREAKKVHPDLYQGNDPTEKNRLQKNFILLTQAYETLIDPAQRRQYDSKYRSQKRNQTKRQQKTHANTRYSSNNETRSQNHHQQSPPFSSTPDTDESLESLLQDIEELLSRFGMKFRDPLEILLDWARQIFQSFMEAWNEDGSPSEKEKQQSSKPSHSSSPFEEVEEELQRLKNKYYQSTRKSSQQASKGDPSQEKKKTSDIEEELRNLKKKIWEIVNEK